MVRKMRRGVVKRKKRENRQSENVVYLRFGDLPEGERSEFGGATKGTRYQHRYRDDLGREKGVSVFEARRRSDGSLVVLTPGGGPYGVRLRSLFLNLALANRPLYEVRGTVVGRGGTGEPLLRDCELTPIPNDVPVRLSPPKDRPFKGVEGWNLWRSCGGTPRGL